MITTLPRNTLILLSALLVTCLLPPTISTANAKVQFRLRYDMFVSGMRAIEIYQDFELGENGYTSNMSLRSEGMAGLFLKLQTDMKATGNIVNGMPAPATFKMDFPDRRYAVTWGEAKKPEAVRQPEIPRRKASAIEAALEEPAADPLTALLRKGFAGADGVCSGAERVYNGREVTEYRFDRLGEDQFGKRAGSVYRGPVIRCQLDYRLIAGFSEKAMAKNRAEPVIITFWVAPVETSAAAKPLMIVVALSGKYDGRPFSAFLNAATVSGRPLNPDSLASR